MTHSPEHLFEKPTLLSALFSVLVFWAISWALLGARPKIGALFWGLKRVDFLSRALFWVGLLARALFWGLLKGLLVHQNLNECLSMYLIKRWKDTKRKYNRHSLLLRHFFSCTSLSLSQDATFVRDTSRASKRSNVSYMKPGPPTPGLRNSPSMTNLVVWEKDLFFL